MPENSYLVSLRESTMCPSVMLMSVGCRKMSRAWYIVAPRDRILSMLIR